MTPHSLVARTRTGRSCVSGVQLSGIPVGAIDTAELGRWITDHPRPPKDPELEEWKSEIGARGGEHGQAFLGVLGRGVDIEQLGAIAVLSELGVRVWIALRDGRPVFFARLPNGVTTIVVPEPAAGVGRPNRRIG